MRRLDRLRSWAASLIFLPVFAAILVIFDVAQRVARLAGSRPHEYVAGALQVALVWSFRLCGTSIAEERAAGIDPRGRYIVISNHQSMFDIPILGALLFWNFPKYISKRSLARWIPSVSYNLRRGGHALIDRGDAPSAVATIRELGERVRAGRASAVIFPEGTRARRGALGGFRPAGTRALLEAAPDTPVVPLAIDESWRLLEHNMLPVPWGVRVRVHVGAPIPRHPDEDPLAIIERARTEIETVLTRWRNGTAAEAAAPASDRSHQGSTLDARPRARRVDTK